MRWGGTNPRSIPSKVSSVNNAKRAAGNAPCKIRPVLFNASPVTMGSPNPPAPMNAASVAVPMLTTAAILMPERRWGSDRGR